MSESYDHRASHPGAVGAQAALWFGTEVEGRYRGHPAAFIARELDKAELSILHRFLANTRVLRKAVKPVVFFTETFDAWEWAASAVFPEAQIVCAGRYVSQLEPMLELRRCVPFHRIELVVRLLDVPRALLLNPSDQISVGVPYDMHTFCVGEGYRTRPSDYCDDRKG